jgi:16S rRNA (adenine1518-N6/adenine1519-N6)-dimethyltransferase
MPAVESAVLRIDLSEQALPCDPHALHFLLKAGFANKRRQVHNALAGSLRLTALGSKQLLEQSEIEPTLRAEQLTLAQWIRLLNAVQVAYPKQSTP